MTTIMKKQIGLLVMAYGTPQKDEDLIPYYTHIRRGHRPTDEQIEDLRSRYQAIGGISPLAATTEKQAYALGARLNAIQDAVEYKVYIGLKHISPFIEDAVEQMIQDGIKEAVGIVLAPHFSSFSTKAYHTRAFEKAQTIDTDFKFTGIDSWYKEEKFLQYWTEKINVEFAGMSEEERETACLVVCAHSLPEKIIAMGDPYAEQLFVTKDLLQQRTGVKNVAFGWQSAGQTKDPWLGPDVQDLTRDLYNNKGYRSFTYIPVGFVAEHLEVLYDNDYECKTVCEELGANYHRPAMPNDDALFIDAMADAVQKVNVK